MWKNHPTMKGPPIIYMMRVLLMDMRCLFFQPHGVELHQDGAGSVSAELPAHSDETI